MPDQVDLGVPARSAGAPDAVGVLGVASTRWGPRLGAIHNLEDVARDLADLDPATVTRAQVAALGDRARAAIRAMDATRR